MIYGATEIHNITVFVFGRIAAVCAQMNLFLIWGFKADV